MDPNGSRASLWPRSNPATARPGYRITCCRRGRTAPLTAASTNGHHGLSGGTNPVASDSAPPCWCCRCAIRSSSPNRCHARPDAPGRSTFGIGIGWDAAKVGADFHTRGKRADEAIALPRRLFAGDRSFRGRFYGSADGFFEPRPHGEIPIMVGGSSTTALRRAAMFADEWQGIGADPAEFAARVRRLRDLPGPTPRVGPRIDRPAAGKGCPACAHSPGRRETLAVRFGAEPRAEERAAAPAEAPR